MKVSENEVLFIYDADDIQQREALAYAKSLKHHTVKELDVQNGNLTQLQISQLASALGVSIRELMRTDNESHFSEVMDLDQHDLLDYLSYNLPMLRTPIAVYHNEARFVGSQYEFIKEDNVNNAVNVQTAKTIRQQKNN